MAAAGEEVRRLAATTRRGALAVGAVLGLGARAARAERHATVWLTGAADPRAALALVAARLGRRDLALHYFRQTAAIDLADSMGNAALGIHIGALGGLWQATVLGFGGLSLRPDGLHFDPHLPEPWDRLSFPVQWHQRLVRVQLQREPAQVTITLERGQPMRCSVGGRARQLRREDVWTCRWDANAGDWQEVA